MANRPSPSKIHEWLSEGDLRSDGLSREVAALAVRNPLMMDDLLDALRTGSDVVRGHAADAVERVSRERPELVRPTLGKLLLQAKQDPVPMVRWHLAMILGNMAESGENVEPLARALLALLDDPSPFVKSWAVSGLCLIGRDSPSRRGRFLAAISRLRNDRSIAVRHRASRAIRLLTDESEPIPPSWVKRKK